jgi:hypothetical protein
MAKPSSGARKATPAAKKLKATKASAPASKQKAAPKKAKAEEGGKKKPVEKVASTAKKAASVAKAATKKVVAQVKKVAATVKEAATKQAPAAKEAPAKEASGKEASPKLKDGATRVKEAAARAKEASGKVSQFPAAERPRPRATKLPPQGEPLNKRDMEQLLTAGAGRGVTGEGSLKGRLVVTDGMPYLVVVGRDKRELTFLLQGPDQEVLPAYVDHKVSVSGLIKKATNYGGSVDVRKFSAKKPEIEIPQPVTEPENKLRFLSPGEVSMVTNAGMGAGMKGFATLRGNLEMTGEEFVLVVSHGGTRQQVSFILEGKGAKGLRKHLGQTLAITGVVDKTSGWGGRIEVEGVELRPTEARLMSREGMELVQVEGEQPGPFETKLNHAFAVRLQEQPGFTWAIEPTAAKRVGLREANFEPSADGSATREFFFSPRNPGSMEIEFFLAKALNPGQVERSFKMTVNVKP